MADFPREEILAEKKATATNRELECGTSLAEQEHQQSLETRLKSVKQPTTTSSSLRDTIAADIVSGNNDGRNITFFESPFVLQNQPVRLPLIYCDHTASNRPLRSIESYMERHCLPLYGNTHTNTSITGSQSTAFVAEARQIVAEEVNAKITGKASLDVVLFA